MKNHYLSGFDLLSLSQLFQERIQKIPTLINSLKLKDVDEDKHFDMTKERIKSEVLLEPITLDEPEFVDHEYEHRQPRLEQQIFSSFNPDIYIHEIRFPYNGNENLFIRSYNGMTVYDPGILKPQSSEFVTVYIELSQLSPETAINKAKDLFRATKYVAENNSESVKRWNLAVEQRIDNDLEAKREELIRLLKK